MIAFGFFFWPLPWHVYWKSNCEVIALEKGEVCEVHGVLKRSCYICELEAMNKELISLNLWSARRLHKSHKEFAYDELEKITGEKHERV